MRTQPDASATLVSIVETSSAVRAMRLPRVVTPGSRRGARPFAATRGGVQTRVGFVNQTDWVPSHRSGIRPNGSPEVAQVAISVVDGFVVTRAARPPQRDRQ